MASRRRGEVMIAAMIVARKSFVGFDRPGASISECFWCRVRRRPSWAAFSLERGAHAIALDVHFDDGGVVNNACYEGDKAVITVRASGGVGLCPQGRVRT